MRKLEKSELKRVYGARHTTGETHWAHHERLGTGNHNHGQGVGGGSTANVHSDRSHTAE